MPLLKVEIFLFHIDFELRQAGGVEIVVPARVERTEGSLRCGIHPGVEMKSTRARSVEFGLPTSGSMPEVWRTAGGRLLLTVEDAQKR